LDSPLVEKTSAVQHTLRVDSPRSPPNLVVRLLRRFFDTFPFLAEIWYWNLTYWYVLILKPTITILFLLAKAV
jgi:hypothetical protein